MIDFIVNNIDTLSAVKYLVEDSSCSILPTGFRDILQEIFTWIKLITPCLVLVLCSLDIAKAVVAQDQKAMSAALSSVVKRVSIGVAIFFLPVLIDFVLDIGGIVSGVCKIGIGGA